MSQIAPHVLLVELNRPEKLNAMDILCWEEIKVCFDLVARDVDTRAVLLSGASKAFVRPFARCWSTVLRWPRPKSCAEHLRCRLGCLAASFAAPGLLFSQSRGARCGQEGSQDQDVWQGVAGCLLFDGHSTLY